MTRKEKEFRTLVWAFYRKHGRHDLPWRKTLNPYRILVSEIMLQQTQVDRVIPFYRAFLKEFPNPKKLAQAPLSKVLKCWQGLGYNRRAKQLQAAAKVITKEGFPKDVAALEKLSGVGSYTARAVAAFAWNTDVIFIETNIRTTIIDHFFPKKEGVTDTDIEKVLENVFPKGRARDWYAALMDYGAHLKRSGISHNAKSKQYVKQSQFKGSLREMRGAILRALANRSQTKGKIENVCGTKRKPQAREALAALHKEGFIERKGNFFSLTSR